MNITLPRRHTFIGTISICYAAGVLGLAAALPTALDRWWPLQLLNVFNVWLYVPLPVLLLIALLYRSKWASVLLLLPLFLFLVQYGIRFVPHALVTSGVPVRVMTWNLRYDNGDVDALVRAIRVEQPDLIAVQELGTPVAPTLAAALRPLYPIVHKLRFWSRCQVTFAFLAQMRRLEA